MTFAVAGADQGQGPASPRQIQSAAVDVCLSITCMGTPLRLSTETGRGQRQQEVLMAL